MKVSTKTTLLITVLALASVGIISGCESPLSDAQIIEAANKHAIAKGLHPQDYDVSISPSGQGSHETPSPGSQQTPDLSRKVKSMTGSDARAVTYTPKSRKRNGAYTFYVDKNTGKLVMVMKRK